MHFQGDDVDSPLQIASLIFAAGRGSRMKGYDGNKTLLPLAPGPDPYHGAHPILTRILENLPDGPKALVLNYRKEDVMRATESCDVAYCEQATLNGTGGALLAAGPFLHETPWDRLVITMGDVPFMKPTTYRRLLEGLAENHLVVLGFRPADKKEYGVLEIKNGGVTKITEWKYWNTYPEEIQQQLEVCNAGIYALRRESLLAYIPVLEQHPHRVLKERRGRKVEVEEFFITDLVEWMARDGLDVGFTVAEDEYEVMGVDDLESLKHAQALFRRMQENPGK
jgi:bifunctional UDP-N-acetylglucosamine pyrophosphorylase/glucosamine-1-phosphate N-acetyltransferase